MIRNHTQVDIVNLLKSRAMFGVDVRYLSTTTTRVQDLALIADIEEIVSVGPDTLILLSERAAMGGWMISAALRYAWERRASALIVPEHAMSDTEVELARRLDVSLLSTGAEVTRKAIEVAMQIGVEKSGAAARIQALMDRLARCSTLQEALRVLSNELDGRRVRVQSSGAMMNVVGLSNGQVSAPPASPSQSSQEQPYDREVTIPIYAGETAGHRLVTGSWTHESDYTEQALRAAVPMVRALIDAARLQRIRASLPPITLAVLTGLPNNVGLDEPRVSALTGFPNWPIAGAYAIVCILTPSHELHGTAVHQVWESAFPDVPLARVGDGWLAFLPVRDAGAYDATLHAMRSCFDAVRPLDLRVGVSALSQDSSRVVHAIREAWFSARLAVVDLLPFGAISMTMIHSLLPEGLAGQLASAMLPALVADPSADEIIDAVVAYLSCRGSSTGAARRLGVHRNTVQARVRKAEELGVPLSDPDELLATHMLLAALARSRSVPMP